MAGGATLRKGIIRRSEALGAPRRLGRLLAWSFWPHFPRCSVLELSHMHDDFHPGSSWTFDFLMGGNIYLAVTCYHWLLSLPLLLLFRASHPLVVTNFLFAEIWSVMRFPVSYPKSFCRSAYVVSLRCTFTRFTRLTMISQIRICSSSPLAKELAKDRQRGHGHLSWGSIYRRIDMIRVVRQSISRHRLFHIFHRTKSSFSSRGPHI